MTPTRRGELYAALAAVGYGSAYVATAFALRSFAPLPAAVYRCLFGSIALAILIVAMRRGSATRAAAVGQSAARVGGRPWTLARATHLLILSACGGPIFLAGMNLAIAGVGATIASFVAGLYAVLAAVLAPFLLREPLRPRALIGFVSALVGTAFLAELDLAGAALGGIGWGLFAAVSFSLFLVLSRKWALADGFDGITVALGTTLATTIGLGAIVLLTAPGSLEPSHLVPEAVVAIAWLAVVVASGQALAVASARLVPASRTAALLLLNPVTATILSFALLGERITPVELLGALLVLAGIAAATVQRPAHRTAPAVST